MASLRNFIAQKPKKREEVYVQDTNMEQELQHEEIIGQSKSRELYLLYAAIQQRHGKWVIPYRKDKRMRTCFRKLAKKFEELAEMGLDVDEVAFIMAHKATYGSDLQPTHLISWCSMDIYQSYLTQQKAEVIKLSEDEERAYDDEMITRLSSIRGESKEEVAQLLESCGLL